MTDTVQSVKEEINQTQDTQWYDNLSDNLIHQLITEFAIPRFKESDPEKNMDSISKDELKKLLNESDLESLHQLKLKKNNELFELYGLPMLKIEELILDNNSEEFSDEHNELYEKLLSEQREKNGNMRFYETLIDTHKHRKMKFIGETDIPNEEEFTRITKRMEDLIAQFQKNQENLMNKDDKKEPIIKEKNKKIHESIKRLNDSKSQRIKRMKDKLEERKNK